MLWLNQSVEGNNQLKRRKQHFDVFTADALKRIWTLVLLLLSSINIQIQRKHTVKEN
jgi:hypothetical protein